MAIVSENVASVVCRWIAVGSLCGIGALGCDQNKGPEEKTEEVEADAKQKVQDEDKGNAVAKLGEREWKAERARARIKDDVLKISASQTDMKDGKVSRQELVLTIKGFEGPGDYEIARMGAYFVGVGMDTDQAAKAKTDEEVTKAATKALSNSSFTYMMGTKVHIEGVSDDFVDGSFEWKGPAGGSKGFSEASGDFHARIKK